MGDTPEEWQKVLEKSKATGLVICLDFFATWCGPCMQITPFVEHLAKKHARKLIVAKVDVDKNRPLKEEFEVKGMPTFKFIKPNGEVVNEFAGADEQKLENLCEQYATVKESG